MERMTAEEFRKKHGTKALVRNRRRALPASAELMLQDRNPPREALEFTVTGKIPSSNNLYATIVNKKTLKSKRTLTTAAREYKALVTAAVKQELRNGGKLIDSLWYKLTIEAYYPIHHKRKPEEVLKRDATGVVKAIEDAMADGLERDDKFFKRIVVEKFDIPHGQDEYVLVKIRTYKPMR